jgi:hypothetical protein
MRLRSVKLVAVLALIALPAILLAGLAAVGFFEPASTPPGSGEPPAGRAAAAPDLPATGQRPRRTRPPDALR